MRPIARAPRANRQDDNDRSVRGQKPFSPPAIPPARTRARGTSKHDAPTPKPAERFGPFVVHELIGEGGMAYVHRAERAGAPRPQIALKRLFPELIEDEIFVEGFLQEARLVKLIDHPNIARAFDHGRIDDTYYLAMEYVPGPTLRSTMIQARSAAGAMPIRIVVEILMQLCDALAHAHELRDERRRPLNLVHRDVSPANIILSSTGVVKLIDFGIAKAAHSRLQTQAGFIKGKISYVAPEYTRGRLDARADLFAVGVIAHEMLANRRLFDGADQMMVVDRVRAQPLFPPSHFDRRIPRDLDDIVMLALQRDPDQRWQNATAMRKALAGVARTLGERVTPTELRDWAEWAFSRLPVRDSFVGMLNNLDGADTAETKPVPRQAPSVGEAKSELLDIKDLMMALVPPPRAKRPTPPPVPPPRNQTEPDQLLGGLLDGWAPPTGTEMVRPKPRALWQGLLAILLVAAVLVALAAAHVI